MRMKHAKLVSKLPLIILFASFLSNILDQIVFQILAFNHVPINDDDGLRFQVIISLLGISVVCVAGLVWLSDFAAYHLYEKKGRPIPHSIIYLIIAIGIGCMTVPFGGWSILASMRINSFQVLMSLMMMGALLITKGVIQLVVQNKLSRRNQP